MMDQAEKRGQLIRHLEDALALADGGSIQAIQVYPKNPLPAACEPAPLACPQAPPALGVVCQVASLGAWRSLRPQRITRAYR